ncbi:hypothetical protein CPC08DRAFT_794255 [Agrocybe pediades]|nr:hypothetical protein CPC08DRAFT_794255 [Agrocybe pediades]
MSADQPFMWPHGLTTSTRHTCGLWDQTRTDPSLGLEHPNTRGYRSGSPAGYESIGLVTLTVMYSHLIQDPKNKEMRTRLQDPGACINKGSINEITFPTQSLTKRSLHRTVDRPSWDSCLNTPEKSGRVRNGMNTAVHDRLTVVAEIYGVLCGQQPRLQQLSCTKDI